MFASKEGQAIPQVTFHTRQGDQWVDVTTQELFADKTVIVFSLPGAFTPTCSSSHLPRYNELAPVFAEHGVDDILCVSVNDTFVMNAWKADQEADNITLIPDGNGEFSKGMGMLVEKEELGFGLRSWRYSMLVKNGRDRKNVHRRPGAGRSVQSLRCRYYAEIHCPRVPVAGVDYRLYQAGLPILCQGQAEPD